MANPNHVEIVKKGATSVADWRKNHPDGRLDLRDADLSNVVLAGADLTEANLHTAILLHANLAKSRLWNINLCGADLSGAILVGSEMSGAHLIDANFTDANLSKVDLCLANMVSAQLSRARLVEANLHRTYLGGANLYRANLNRAQLSGADLTAANLNDARLSGADLDFSILRNTALRGTKLDGARFRETALVNLDLSETHGLEYVTHDGPNSLGIDTLVKSKGKIPESFLRGCGVPDAMIQYLPSILGAMEPIQFYSCFLSHSSKDEEFAKRLHGRLEREKLRVWCAPEDMRGGRKTYDQIDLAIREYDRLLLVLSENSMNSEWVRTEIKKARKKERDTRKEVLFPIAIVPFIRIREWSYPDLDTGEDLAEKVRTYHIPDFSNWKNRDSFENGFAELMRDLRREDERANVKKLI